MLKKIDDPEFIALVEKNIPIKTLERRMQGGDLTRAHNNDVYMQQILDEHGDWDDFSIAGFLGNDESLLEVIHSDWKVVNSHGTTHRNIAIALKNLIMDDYELDPDYIYLGIGRYRQFSSAIDFIMSDDGSLSNSDFGHLNDGGYQSCPWLCYSKNKPVSRWDEFKDTWESDDENLVSKRQDIASFFNPMVRDNNKAKVFKSNKKASQFIAQRIDNEENLDSLYENWTLSKYRSKIESLINQAKETAESINDDPFYFLDKVDIFNLVGSTYYNSYLGTLGVILRKEIFTNGKLEEYISYFKDCEGSYFPTLNGAKEESHFYQLQKEVIKTLDDYESRYDVVLVPVTGLLPHLIGTHYFFEGKQTTHRADPAFLIDALNLTGH